MGSREKGRSEIRQKQQQLKVFSTKESRVIGEVGQERGKMGYNYIMFVLAHFLTLTMYIKSV